MSEFLTDLIQNIYTRISQLGKSIQSLQETLDRLNATLKEKVTSLVESIRVMSQTVDREGETQKLVFEQIRESAIAEIIKLQERVGKKDMDELLEKLKKIVESSEEALKPETVDVLLAEVLANINKLKDIDKEACETEGTPEST
jgi:methyl-accepting chemotaxis protein